MADKTEGKKDRERGDGEGDLTFNLQRRQTSERVIFRPTAVTDGKGERKSDKRMDKAI